MNSDELELVKRLEQELQTGTQSSAEQCLKDFPHLRWDKGIVLRLIAAEFRYCMDHGKTLRVDRYIEQFPEFQLQIRGVLNGLRVLREVQHPPSSIDPDRTGLSSNDREPLELTE